MVCWRGTRSSTADRRHEPVSIEKGRASYLSVERKGISTYPSRLVRSINRASNDGGSGATDPTIASTNQVPTQPTMMDLLARLTVAPSTPPIQSRSPALTSSQSAQQFQTQASPRPEPSRLTASVSDPSTSLKQLLGVMSPVQTSATPVRTGTPPRRAPPDSPSVSRPRAKKGDSGYIPSSERNVEPSDEGFDKGAARVAILGALKGGQAEARGIQSESIEPSKEGQRDFVRGLLNCIHVSPRCSQSRLKGGVLIWYDSADGQGICRGTV
jgi:hypothetical protein